MRVPSFELVNQNWTCSADHHTGQRLLENAALKGLTEDRTRSPAHSDHKPSCITGGNHRRLSGENLFLRAVFDRFESLGDSRLA